MAESRWRAGLLLVCVAGSVIGFAGCGYSDDAKDCVNSGASQVCAWRDGAVRV